MYDTRAGVRIAKFVADGADLAVGLHCRSERPEPVVVQVREDLPPSAPVAALTFDSDRWSVADGECLRWTGVVDSAHVATYECALPVDLDREAFHSPPVVESVEPVTESDTVRGDPRSGAAFQEVRTTVEPLDLQRTNAATCDASFGARTDAVAFEELVTR